MKNEGSALILAILLLTFFMALSLNMFYISQKKSERATYKAIGTNSLSFADSGSSLGYYELALASKYVTYGAATTVDTDVLFLSFDDNNFDGNNVPEDILLSSYNDYFTRRNFNDTDDTSPPVEEIAVYDASNNIFMDQGTTYEVSTGNRITGVADNQRDITTTERLASVAGAQLATFPTGLTNTTARSIGGYVFVDSDTTSGINTYMKRVRLFPAGYNNGTPMCYQITYRENVATEEVVDILVEIIENF